MLVDEAKPEELLGHELAHLLVVIVQADPGAQQLRGIAHHAEHGVVHLALAVGEAAGHRQAPGHVARVVAVLGADVHQQHITVLADRAVLDVVEHAGVGAARHDGRVGEPARALADELMQVFGLDFVFGDAGLQEVHHAVESIAGDAAGVAHPLDFLSALHAARAVKNGGGPFDADVGVGLTEPLVEPGFAGLDHDLGAGVLVLVEVAAAALGHEALDGPLQHGQPLNLLHAGLGGGFRLGQLGALPDGNLLVGLRDEQDLPVGRIVRVGEEQQHGLLLVHTGEVEHVGVLPEGQGAVGAGRVDVVGAEQGHRAGAHGLGKGSAVADVILGGQGRVTQHAPKLRPPSRQARVTRTSEPVGSTCPVPLRRQSSPASMAASGKAARQKFSRDDGLKPE